MGKIYVINRSELIRAIKSMDGSCTYRLGAKPRLKLAAERVKESDCSGFVRYIVYHTTGGLVKLPFGSWRQEGWCVENLQACSYSDAAKSDSVLRIAFISAEIRHVWLIASGRTIEAYGGRGVGRRRWDTPGLVGKNPRCYVVGRMT